MKTIGLVGGTTWFSTIDYYRYINQLVNEQCGGDEAARLILYSVNYGEIKKLTLKDDWQSIAGIITNAAKSLQAAGADVVILCANTMHNIFNEVEAALQIPMIHIADAVAAEIQSKVLNKVALLGTKYTMQLPFFAERLNRYHIEVIIPDQQSVEYINASIYNELGKGQFLENTKSEYLRIIKQLAAHGAQGVILGCTEIPLLINQKDTALPVLDTTLIHAKAAVKFSLS